MGESCEHKPETHSSNWYRRDLEPKQLATNNPISTSYILNRIKHQANPLHIRCRLLNLLEFMPYSERKKIVKPIITFYEKNIYNGNGGSRLSKILKGAKAPFIYAKNRFSRPDFEE
ncbi:MAG: hypothetical protein V1768_03590 [Patescibacteria group bacterium]